MSDPFTSALELTERELSKARSRIVTLTAELANEKLAVRKLSVAAKTLERLRKSATPSTSQASGERLTQQRVRPLLQAILRDNPQVEAEVIYDLLRDKLAEEGCPAQGLGLRVKEILAEDWVCEVKPGVFALRVPEPEFTRT